MVFSRRAARVTAFVFTWSAVVEALPAALVQSGSVPELQPSLRPESDKRFFKKDYPDDVRPAVTEYHKKYQSKYDFTHPYPIVQESGKYDSDFVSDENNDSGEWKAQEEYDKLRIQMAKLKAEVDRLGSKEQEAKNDLETAQAKEDEAELASKAAEEKFDAAKKEADQAQDKEDALVESSKDASAEVQKEMRQLRDCRSELREAKEALERHIEKQKCEKDCSQHLQAKVESTAEAAEEAEAVEEKWEDKLAREKKEYQLAKESYEKEARDVREVELLLEKAAEKLRKFRAEGVDQDGGVYRVDKDGKKIAFHHTSAERGGASQPAALFSAAAFAVLAAPALAAF